MLRLPRPQFSRCPQLFLAGMVSASLVAVWVGVLSAAADQPPSGAPAAPAPEAHAAFDVNDCKACHEAVFPKFEKTAHASSCQPKSRATVRRPR